MNKTGFSGSALFYGLALSGVALQGAGSTVAFNLANYGFANVLLTSDSADLVVNVERSSASNGTFAAIGASLGVTASQMTVRGFPLESSATFYRATYSIEGSGSHISNIIFAAQGARRVPITQPTGTTVFSTVIP